MKNNGKTWLLAVGCVMLGSLAQAKSFFPEKAYPKGYFRNPLNVPIELAGNFGECRPNHFHSGIDIKTQQKENLPVHAAADGYISRIKIEPGGFGNAIYITHPNGYVTLYAHLNKYAPELDAYVKKKQYENESWRIDQELKPSLFPVKKGQMIAWSGNTGSSEAPHLHFEIRDGRNEKPLNPLLFGFDVADTKAPVLNRLAIYNKENSLYEQSPVLVALHKKGNVYVPPTDTLKVNAYAAGLALSADDFINSSYNTLGIFEMRLFLDDAPQFAFQLDNIGYDETRYMNAHADYKTRKSGGPWLQCCFKMPGDRLDIYQSFNNLNGVLDISDGKVHQVRMEVDDAAGNTSVLQFCIVQKGTPKATACAGKLLVPGKINVASGADYQLSMPENALYDNVCLNPSSKPMTTALSNLVALGSAAIPVHTYFDLRIKPAKVIAPDQKNKLAIVQSAFGKQNGKAAQYDGTWANVKVRDFGDYKLVADTQGPKIASAIKPDADLSKASRISFTVTDAITSVDKFRAELDGKWLRFVQRGNVFYYDFDEKCPAGKHALKVTAADENGNQTVYTLNFKR